MTRKTLFPTLFLALALSLVLVVPVGAQQAELGTATDAAILSTIHDLPDGQLVLLRGTVEDVTTIITKAESLRFAGQHRAIYLDIRLPTTEQVVRVLCEGSNRQRCRSLERGEDVFATARLGGARPGLSADPASLSLIDLVRE